MAAKNGSKPAEWVFDFNAIKRKEKQEFLDMLERAIAEKDDDLLLPYMVRTITSWPYPLDPARLEDYGELGFEEWIEVVARFMDRFPTLQSAQQRIGDGGAEAGAGDSGGRSESPDA